MLRAGQLLAGRYRIGALLGEGGYGRVYQATQLPLGREVAIKIVNATDAELAARFAREAAIIQSLEHPNTVRVLDIGATPEGHPFLALELLRGQDVDQLLERQGCLSAEMALDVTAQVLKSLAEAHEKGIVHRDIKPANVFITSHFGEPTFVKVLDFGIAKRLQSREKLTVVGETVGTPSYMPPEQAMGLPIDARTDLYAVGLMLAEMVTGKLVFAKGGPMTILSAQAGRAPVPLGPEVTDSVVGPIVARAVQKQPSERYQSAAAMLVDVVATQAALARGPAPHTAFGLPDRPETAATLARSTAATLSALAIAPTALASANVPAARAVTMLPAITIPPRPLPAQIAKQPGARQPALVIAMAALILTLAVVVVALLGKGGGNGDRRQVNQDDDEDDKKPRRKVSPTAEIDALPLPPRTPRPRLHRDSRISQLKSTDIAVLKRALTSAGYKLDLESSSVDNKVHSFTARKDSCYGTISFVESADEDGTERLIASHLRTPGARIVAEGAFMAFVALPRMGSTESGIDAACSEAAARLLAR